jgi:hypothetical protein
MTDMVASRRPAVLACLFVVLLAAAPAWCVTDASPAASPSGSTLPGAEAAAAATAAALAAAAASTPTGTSGTGTTTIGAAAAPASAPAEGPSGSIATTISNAAAPGTTATPVVQNAPTIIPPIGTTNISIPGISAASQPVAPKNLPPLAVCKFVVSGTAGAPSPTRNRFAWSLCIAISWILVESPARGMAEALRCHVTCVGKGWGNVVRLVSSEPTKEQLSSLSCSANPPRLCWVMSQI